VKAREVTVPSRTTPGEVHRVLIGIDGAYACTCPGYEYRAHCWAIEYVKEELMTNESTALVPMKVEPPKSLLPSQDELSVISTLAKTVVLARGHAVPMSIDSPAKAAAVMLAGRELGVPPMSALRHISVVGGKTEPDAQLMAGIVVAHEPDARFEVVELTEESCTMRFTRPSRGPDARWEYTYTVADAERAGITKPSRSGAPSNWKLYTKDMLRWACLKRLARTYASDLINGVGTIEVSGMASLVTSDGDSETDAIDVPALAQRQLYAEGDEPEFDVDEDGVVVEPAEAAAAPTEPESAADDKAAAKREADEYNTARRGMRDALGAVLRSFGWAPPEEPSAETWAAFWAAMEAADYCTDVLLLRTAEDRVVPVEPGVVSLEAVLAITEALTTYLSNAAATADTDAQQPALVGGES
jgi:hypothetical protein